jgi:hypothetical protein
VHEHARRYEQARQVAASGGADGWRHGLGVLAARGVAAWMATWAALTPAGARPGSGTTEQAEPSPATHPPEGGARSTGSACTSFPPPPPPPAAAAVVAVLAQMTLAHARSPA